MSEDGDDRRYESVKKYTYAYDTHGCFIHLSSVRAVLVLSWSENDRALRNTTEDRDNKHTDKRKRG